MFDPTTHRYQPDPHTAWANFDSPYCSLAYLTALHLVDSYFPRGGRLLDIGGGSGRYALEMAQRGYEVTLIDPSPVELDLALARFTEARLGLEAVIESDADRLPMLQSEAYDTALVIGPLYGTLTPVSRGKVLAEIMRLLKPGGVAIVSYLSAWGLLRRTVTDFNHMAADYDNLQSLFDPGVHGPWFWTTPPEAQRELRAAGFNVISYAAAEGYLAGMQPLLNAVEDLDRLDNIIDVAVESSEHPAVRCLGEHLHLVIERP
jgi:SAM-dependent methyltransferase